MMDNRHLRNTLIPLSPTSLPRGERGFTQMTLGFPSPLVGAGQREKGN